MKYQVSVFAVSLCLGLMSGAFAESSTGLPEWTYVKKSVKARATPAKIDRKSEAVDMAKTKPDADKTAENIDTTGSADLKKSSKSADSSGEKSDLILPELPDFNAPIGHNKSGKGVYLRLDSTLMLKHDATITLEETGKENAEKAGKYRGDLGVGAGIGFRFNRYLRLDATLDYLSLVNRKDTISTTVKVPGAKDGVPQITGVAQTTGLINGYVDLYDSMPFPNVIPYLGLGGGISYMNVKETTADMTMVDGEREHLLYRANSYYAPTVAILAGTRVKLSQHFALDLGYRFLWATDLKFGESRKSAAISEGVKNYMHHGIRAGLQFHF